eukprot:2117062-Rhodomonas_salina.1
MPTCGEAQERLVSDSEFMVDYVRRGSEATPRTPDERKQEALRPPLAFPEAMLYDPELRAVSHVALL